MKILIIEDDRKLAEALRSSLTEHGYLVDMALDGVSGLQLAYETQYNLIILDIGLPGIDGFEVLNRVREHDNVRIMMLSARTNLEDRVRGLEQGADDYLVKPFALSELRARVFAMKRRGIAAADFPVGQNVLRVADLELDLLRHRAARGRARIDLTAKEFGLLTILMRREGEVLSCLMLAEHVWDMNFNGNTSVVQIAVRRLRKKVDDPFEVKLLHTIRGMGYTIEYREAK